MGVGARSPMDSAPGGTGYLLGRPHYPCDCSSVEMMRRLSEDDLTMIQANAERTPPLPWLW